MTWDHVDQLATCAEHNAESQGRFNHFDRVMSNKIRYNTSMPKFIYFDVGGVLIKDFTANAGWNNLLKAVNVPNEKEAAFAMYWNELAPQICTTIDVDTLIPEINERFETTIDLNSSLLSEFVNRFEASPTIQKVCDVVAKDCSVGLLTNMYPRMLDEIMKADIMPTCDWDIVIDSSKVGAAKPNPKIFQIAEEQCGEAPADILFIDNAVEHLEVAADRGWDTYYFDPKTPEQSANAVLAYLIKN